MQVLKYTVLKVYYKREQFIAYVHVHNPSPALLFDLPPYSSEADLWQKWFKLASKGEFVGVEGRPRVGVYGLGEGGDTSQDVRREGLGAQLCVCGVEGVCVCVWRVWVCVCVEGVGVCVECVSVCRQ